MGGEAAADSGAVNIDEIGFVSGRDFSRATSHPFKSKEGAPDGEVQGPTIHDAPQIPPLGLKSLVGMTTLKTRACVARPDTAPTYFLATGVPSTSLGAGSSASGAQRRRTCAQDDTYSFELASLTRRGDWGSAVEGCSCRGPSAQVRNAPALRMTPHQGQRCALDRTQNRFYSSQIFFRVDADGVVRRFGDVDCDSMIEKAELLQALVALEV
jgi:hypothetical protein